MTNYEILLKNFVSFGYSFQDASKWCDKIIKVTEQNVINIEQSMFIVGKILKEHGHLEDIDKEVEKILWERAMGFC